MALPRMGTVKVLVTVQDLLPVTLREARPQRFDQQWCYSQILSGISSAAARVCVSRSTQEELEHEWSIAGGSTQVILYGVTPGAVAGYDRVKDELLRRLNLTQGYLLYEGSLLPRQNIEGLLHAFAAVPRDRRPPLVLLSSVNRERQAALAQVAQELNVDHDVHFLDPLSDHERMALFHGARLLVHPGLFDAFSVAVLDALGIGLPTLCMRETGMAESTAGAAIHVDFSRPHVAAAALSDILGDDDRYEYYRQLSLAQGQRSSSTLAAAQYMALYQRLLAADRRP